MRLSVALAVAAAIAVAVYVGWQDDDAASTDAGAVTLVGDSLNVGIEPYLARELPGWQIDAHDRVGRATPEGIEELRRLGARLAPIVVISLGTNDPDGSEQDFRRRVAEAVSIVGPTRCIVWATIVRDGEPRTSFNDVLRESEADVSNVRLVDWAAMVAADPGLLEGDLVHGTPDGYADRARKTAAAVRACPRT